MALATGFMKEMYGVLGEVAIVHRGKKAFVRKRPTKSLKPPTELALAKKAKFGLAGKIAGKISSIEDIKYFWKPDPDKNQTGYNRLFHANHGQFDIEDFSGKIVLSEGNGLEVLNPSIAFEGSGLVINCDSFESVDAEKREAAKYIRTTGIIVLKNSRSEACPEYDLMTFMSDMFPIVKGEKFSARIKYLAGDVVRFQNYAVKKAFGVFITVDGEWELTDISETFESDLSDNSGCVGSEGAENVGNEVSETKGNILEG
jgi:hypothetical protein